MHNSWPFIISNKAPEQALAIVYNYFERKYGNVSDDLLQSALTLLHELYREKEMRPLMLANKVIAVLERQSQPHPRQEQPE